MLGMSERRCFVEFGCLDSVQSPMAERLECQVKKLVDVLELIRGCDSCDG